MIDRRNRLKSVKGSICILVVFAMVFVAVASLFGGVAAADEPYIKISSKNLSLDDNIYIYFRAYYDGIDTSKEEYGMIFWKEPQDDSNYTYANAQNSDRAVIIKEPVYWTYDSAISKNVATYSYKIAAKEMADMVYAQAYAYKNDTYYYSKVVPYSVTTYAARKLGLVEGINPSKDENLKNLLRGMLEYGALAQKYFNYNTENLATDILKADSTETYTVTFKDGETILKSETVEAGKSAVAPTNTAKPGYRFVGWDKSFDSITSDTVVNATYERAQNQLFFRYNDNGDGTTTVTLSICGDVKACGFQGYISYSTEMAVFKSVIENSVSSIDIGSAVMSNGRVLVFFNDKSGGDITTSFDIASLTFDNTGADVQLKMNIENIVIFDAADNDVAFEIANTEYKK